MKYGVAWILALWLCFMPVSVIAEEYDTITETEAMQEETEVCELTVQDVLQSVVMQGTGLCSDMSSDFDPDEDTQLTVRDAYYLAVYQDKTKRGMKLPLSDFMRQKLFPFQAAEVREYRKNPFIYVHHNKPYFNVNPAEIPDSLELYSELDSLGRCGSAIAIISRETMPTEPRGAIGMIKPSGWQTTRYDFVDGGYLYNRCHLIGYQLAGENANPLNLITGTRYLNTIGMLPFENRIAAYVQQTKNRVLYRVTPIFVDDELIAKGVLLEAFSLEDRGQGICFTVYCYNVQPDVTIDYKSGDSWLTDRAPETTEITTCADLPTEAIYVLNTRSKRFHLSDCDSVKDIKDKNKQSYSGKREGLIEQGYKPCGICKP